ncbi:hypothetical protein BgiBS90_000928 [Biomphalaria glabrata]|nr:hypothetical protein BgiBS90_000928 [Biomphalaria glabrata]
MQRQSSGLWMQRQSSGLWMQRQSSGLWMQRQSSGLWMQSPFLMSLDVEPLNAKPIPQSTGCRPNLSGTKIQSPILNRLDDESIPQATASRVNPSSPWMQS